MHCTACLWTFSKAFHKYASIKCKINESSVLGSAGEHCSLFPCVVLLHHSSTSRSSGRGKYTRSSSLEPGLLACDAGSRGCLQCSQLYMHKVRQHIPTAHLSSMLIAGLGQQETS